jgi:hypothetical protein
MEFEAPLDAFAREQRAGLGALARMSKPDDWDPPGSRDWDPPGSRDWDPLGSRDWDPPLASRLDRDWPPAEEPGLPDVTSRSLGPWG